MRKKRSELLRRLTPTQITALNFIGCALLLAWTMKSTRVASLQVPAALGLAWVTLESLRQQRNNQKLEEQQRRWIHASKMSALGEMASGIAHEINNPLSVIYGEAEDLRELATEEKLNFEQVARAAHKIEATTERISRIVKGLRSFARDSTGEEFQAAPLYQIIEDTLAFCLERFKKNDTSLEVARVPTTLLLECRRVQISQVLLNLLNNAFDALQAQAVRKIKIEFRELGDSIELAISDNGPGIPDSIRDKIFQPFFTTKEVGKGTGLGLSIASGIIGAHRGTLTVEAPPTGGTTFRLVLPRQQTKPQKIAA